MMFGIDSLYIWLAVIIISVAAEAATLASVRHLVRGRGRRRRSSRPAFRSDLYGCSS